ncbi:hypothetical protein [Vibrio phage JSF12]|uniref:Uncharacterized protein n=2 Tax=Jesfedecavirus TaxID=2560156 RepID=A0A2D0Z1M6_9CAUD|nr:hypothetical protein FDI98_gp029 [Vibrio phage JSF10]YP_009794760.1 hypothetical protein HOS35_gp077 [Vibrio phage JSF12]ASV43503.1 hypothetical protein [Vibrio phage JSF10]ASV43595.1 hypothetical protein [Vibrio phage JSF12]
MTLVRLVVDSNRPEVCYEDESKVMAIMGDYFNDIEDFTIDLVSQMFEGVSYRGLNDAHDIFVSGVGTFFQSDEYPRVWVSSEAVAQRFGRISVELPEIEFSWDTTIKKQNNSCKATN